jgi:hypothetical protein
MYVLGVSYIVGRHLEPGRGNRLAAKACRGIHLRLNNGLDN